MLELILCLQVFGQTNSQLVDYCSVPPSVCILGRLADQLSLAHYNNNSEVSNLFSFKFVLLPKIQYV